jgi:hypothetical protein
MTKLQGFLSMFKSSTGNYDITRVIGTKISFAFTGSFMYAVFKLHQVINWSEAGIGFATMCGGVVAIIGLKEVAIGKANVLNGQANATQP